MVQLFSAGLFNAFFKRAFAEAILQGDPTGAYAYVRRIVIGSGGSFVALNEAKIREVCRKLEELEKILVVLLGGCRLRGACEIHPR